MRDSELFDPPTAELGRRVTRGAVHTGAAQVVRLGTQFGSAVLLSRLLSPADIGLMAMAWPIFAFALLFQELGLTQAVVQKASITRGELNTLFWINLAVSLLLALLLAAIGPLAGMFYDDSRAGLLTSAMALSVIIAGIGAQPGAILNRRMEFGRLALIDAGGAVAGLAVSVIWAVTVPSYWALYAGLIANTLFGTLGQWRAAGWSPSWPRLTGGWRELLHFGAGLTGFNIANFFARNLGSILIGRYQGNAALGLYDRAYKLLLFPLQQVNGPLQRVTIPALARLAGDPDRYRNAYLRTVGQALLASLPGVAFMTAMAGDLIPLLLGERWREVAPIFAALGFAGLLQPLNNTAGWLFMSQGRAQEYMNWGIVTAITAVIAFVCGLPFGPFGVAAAYAASEYVRTPLLWWYVGRRGPVGWRDIVRIATPHVAGAAFSFAALAWIENWLPLPVPAKLAVGVLASYAISLVIVALFPSGRATIGQSLALFAGLRMHLFGARVPAAVRNGD
ncbi:MAG: lipopolysaccharide biosynthesis protein [Aliidongia sp.]